MAISRPPTCSGAALPRLHRAAVLPRHTAPQSCSAASRPDLAVAAPRPAPAPPWPCRRRSVLVGCLGPLQVVFEVGLVGFFVLGSSGEPVGDRRCHSSSSTCRVTGQGRGRRAEFLARQAHGSLGARGAERQLGMGPEGSPKAQVKGGFGPRWRQI